jgi:transcription termination factor NusB
MGKRREARERAVQFLFQHDLNPPEDLELALEAVLEFPARRRHRRGKRPGQLGPAHELPPPTAEEAETRLFADPLIRGVLEHRDAIDERIKSTRRTGIFTASPPWTATSCGWPF